jgi:hypothetical protein
MVACGKSAHWSILFVRTYKCGMRNIRATVVPFTFVALAGLGTQARADYIDRPLVLPRSVWALDLGLGIGHRDNPAPIADTTGFGFNLELRGGISDSVELGVRTGIRLDSEGRGTVADVFGRTFDTETYHTGTDTFANPEVALRLALARGDAGAVGLEGRVYVPVDGGRAGILLGLPLHLHIGTSARFDSGVYVPIIFTKPDTTTIVSIPLHLWFEVERVSIGLLTGVRIYNPGSSTAIPLGVGLNFALSHEADLRTWLLFPNVKGSGATDYFGGGVGLELRF